MRDDRDDSDRRTDPAPPLRVLVVDDEPDILQEIMDFFVLTGIAASAAENAASARDRIAAAGPNAFTVVVADVRMAGEDGLSLAADILKATPDAGAIEFILITGSGTFSIAIEALRARVFDFIPKPVHLAKLADSVRRAHEAAASRRRRAAEIEDERNRLRAMLNALSERAEAMSAEAARIIEGANDDFLRTVEDELRNPLGPVLGFAELIEGNGPNLSAEQLVEYAGMIREAGQHLTDRLNAILKLSALRRGVFAAERRAVAADRILADLLRRREALALEHEQSITVTPAPGVVVDTDREHLAMALDQLVTNAIRFGRRGQTVAIGAAEDGGDIVFSVADQGPGMDEKARQTLLQPFRRGDMSLTRATGGLGLGLTLAGELAGALGGILRLNSAPGQGTVAAIAIKKN